MLLSFLTLGGLLHVGVGAVLGYAFRGFIGREKNAVVPAIAKFVDKEIQAGQNAVKK